MFSQVLVCPRGGGRVSLVADPFLVPVPTSFLGVGYLWSRVPSRVRWVYPTALDTLPSIPYLHSGIAHRLCERDMGQEVSFPPPPPQEPQNRAICIILNAFLLSLFMKRSFWSALAIA